MAVESKEVESVLRWTCPTGAIDAISISDKGSRRTYERREFRALSADVRMKATEKAGSLKTSDGSIIGNAATQ